MAAEKKPTDKKYANIYQKLLVIQQRINGLGKDKTAFNYKYVTGDKVLGEIKPLMNDLGLLLKQEVLSIENTRQDYKAGQREISEILSKVMMRFTWVDTDTGEKDENLFGANGQNGWDKGVGSALTYSERYFLLKYFHIATDEDDIDNPERKPEAAVSTPQLAEKAQPEAEAEELDKKTPATKDQMDLIHSILDNPFFTDEQRDKGKSGKYTVASARAMIKKLNEMITNSKQ